MTVTKTLEWDMGHRIPHHKNKCKNLHGHRYKLEITMEGGFVRRTGASSKSMIMDFGDIKEVARREIADRCDHAFMYWKNDPDMARFFKIHKSYKSISVSFIPTAEEISRWIFTILDTKYKDVYKTGLALHSITLWETPTSKAFYNREDFAQGSSSKIPNARI